MTGAADTIEARLRDPALAAFAAALAALARPCVFLRTTLSDDASIPAGATKLGGAPDLAKGAAWPAWNGAPLSFLLQVDLRDAAGMPGAEVLPRDGLLSFFYDAEQQTWGYSPDDRGSWRVLYTPAGTPLDRVQPPSALPEHGRFTPCAVAAAAGVTLPSWEEAAIEGLGMDEEASDAYVESAPHLEPNQHQLLGWPEPIQTAEMGLECQLASRGIYVGGPEGYADPRAAALKPGAAEWRLLLQVESDEEAGMMWGDGGRLYFWIRDADLAARDWDAVWMVLQCY